MPEVLKVLTKFVELCVCMLIFMYKSPTWTHPLQTIDELPERSYVHLGDINLGAFFSVTEYSKENLCVERMRFPLMQQYIEAVVFSINEINENPDLLPNITLGYVILDDCVKQSAATAQAVRFLPRVNSEVKCGTDKESNCDKMSLQFGEAAHYDVVGVIGPLRSDSSIAVSYLLGPAKIPQISFLSTSDQLSHKEISPYFLRLVPPDEHQVRAVLMFVLSQGWTYISVLYSDGSYGEHAYNSIKHMTAKWGICIATHYKIEEAAVEKDYTKGILKLLKFPRARVVLAFLEGEDMVGVFTAVHNMSVSRMFIWVGSDGWSDKLMLLGDDYQDALYGSFTTMFHLPPVPKFNEYFSRLKPSTTMNPWFSEFWERQFNCSIKEGTCDESQNITNSRGFHPLTMISSAMDTVYTYAYAIHNLINDYCPGIAGKDARACIKGDILLTYLKNVSFIGYSGQVKFDKQGNVVVKYVISQILPDNPVKQVPVRIIDTSGKSNITKVNSISWKFVDSLKAEFPLDLLPPPPVTLEENDIPVSVCSRLCGIGEYKIQTDEPCCWQCRFCRDNEIVTTNKTACQACPLFFWPERITNLTTCKEIVPDYPIFTDVVVIFESCTSCIGIIAAIGVLFSFGYYREARIIKAASRELSFLQLSAIGMGYVTMLVYVAPPTHITCVIAYWLFCFSFALLYAPLLVKAVRIYRIFNSASMGTRGLKFISPLSQVVISCAIVMGQVLISILVTGIEKPTAILTQPVRSEPFVELSCDITLPGLVSFLAYNLTLVLLCSIFAFKTRALPDNFNESRFMSMCVATTLVIWLAFIPTFLTSSRQYLKTLLLTLALLLNHSIALVFLFVSKLYAVIYLQNEVGDLTHTIRSHEVLRTRSRNSYTCNDFNGKLDMEQSPIQT